MLKKRPGSRCIKGCELMLGSIENASYAESIRVKTKKLSG